MVILSNCHVLLFDILNNDSQHRRITSELTSITDKAFIRTLWLILILSTCYAENFILEKILIIHIETFFYISSDIKKNLEANDEI